MNKKKIWLSSPHIGDEEIKFVMEAFETNWVAPVGPHLEAFEKELALYNGMAHCAALSSGTAAIHLALIILGVNQGDEVLCSSFTFSGSCNPIKYLAATPVFIDSEADSWNMDPDLLDEGIKDRIKRTGKTPKAIIAVHLYGMPAKMDRLMEVAKEYNIPVIEDAAEAIGSARKGKKLGTFGDMGIYSFNGNKIITTSGGGAMVSQNGEWVREAKFLATQARDPAPHYEHSQVGYNYRLSNICAGIGRGQLRVLDERVRQRRTVFEFYQKHLGIEGISFQPEGEGSYSNRWLTCLVLDKRHPKTPEDIRRVLESENIESRPLWKPMHLQPVFKGTPYYGNGVSEALFQRGLCLPSGSNLSEEDLGTVVEVVRRVIK